MNKVRLPSLVSEDVLLKFSVDEAPWGLDLKCKRPKKKKEFMGNMLDLLNQVEGIVSW